MEWTCVSRNWPGRPMSKYGSRSKWGPNREWVYRLTVEAVHLWGYDGAKTFKTKDQAIAHLDKVAMKYGSEVTTGWRPKKVWWNK